MTDLPWIRVDIDLKDTPEADRLDAALGERRTWTYVVELWCWAARHAPTGDLSGIENATVARRAGWAGDAEKFVGGLIASGFLSATGTLKWWAEQQSKRLERAEQDAERKRAERAARAASAQPRKKPQQKASTGRPQDVRRTSAGQAPDVLGTSDGRRAPSCVTVRDGDEDGDETNTNPPLPPSAPPAEPPRQVAAHATPRGGQAYEDRWRAQNAPTSGLPTGDAMRMATRRVLQAQAEAERFCLLEGLAERAGVELRLKSMVAAIEPGRVILRRPPDATGEADTGGDGLGDLEAATICWTAGVRASRLGRLLAERTGAPVDRGGRLQVEADFSLPAHPEIRAVGDLCHYSHTGDGRVLPGMAGPAVQMGGWVARDILAGLEGRRSEPFRWFDLGSMAVIGPWYAVADLRGLHVRGLAGWILWALAHLAFIPDTENRIALFSKWMWQIATRQRTALLITGRPDQHLGVDVGLERAAPPGSRDQSPEEPPSAPLNRLISTPRITAM